MKKKIYKSKIKRPLKKSFLPGQMGRVGHTWQDLFTDSDIREIKLDMINKGKKK